MSFSNDEEGDGLAALFGGVTPVAAAPGEPGTRRAARAAASDASAEPAPGPAPAPTEASGTPAPTGWSPATPTQYPGLAPSASAAEPPAAAPPASAAYDLPTPAAQGPRSYDLPPPAAAPAAPAWSPEPAAPAWSPEPASQPTDPQPPPPFGAQQYGSPQPPPGYETPQPPPAYEAPQPPPSSYGAPPAPAAYASPQPPAYEAPQPPPSYPSPQAPAAYDLPAPADAPNFGAAPAGPAYPPTAQFPAGLDVPAAYPAPSGPSYAPPAPDPSSYAPPSGPGYDVPTAAPAPLEEPPPFAAPSPGYEAYARPAAPPEIRDDPPRYDPQPVPSSRDEHPLVLSEPAVPATVFPPGPLLPSSTAAVTPEDLERSTAMEKVGLALALLTGPIGLGVAIANAIRSGRRRGWLIGVVRASLVLGVLSSIAAGIAGYLLWNMRLDQIAHAEVAAASAEFCAAAEADPTMVTPPTLGWPAQGASVGESITLMQAWTDRWTTLAPESPATLRTGMELLAETGQTIVDGVTTARVVDDAANQAQIAAAAGQSGVAGWYTKYCVTP